MTGSNALRGGCVILGGGGHAKVVLEALRLREPRLECIAVDADRSRWGRKLLDVCIVGGDGDLAEWLDKGYPNFAVGVGGVGDNALRRHLFELAISCGLAPVPVVHPSATVSSWAIIGKGVQLLSGCIVNAGVTLGNNALVNSGAVVEHDCVVEDHVHVATGSRLGGGVRVCACAHVGIGAVLKQGVTVGVGAVVGAGAAVVKDVANNTTVVGVPARPLVKGRK
jgi:sugar O-acyltransferase (sialic acid O-acetyltransferase NeuD family)